MVRISQKLSVIGLLAVLFVMGMSGAMADSTLEVDYYGGYDAAGTTMQGNLSSAYEVAANEITRWIQVIFNREPVPGEVEGWVTGYFAYMVSLFIDVEYVIQEMARQFFLSAEYAWIYNGDLSVFLTDAYQAFLDRDPWADELNAWLAGSSTWTLETALSAFLGDDAVRGRVDVLFGTGYEGLTAENLTAQFYLGVLNRLPAEDELDAWVDVFDDNTLPQEFIDDGILIATSLLGSPEFDIASKTDAEIITALIRGALNRYPQERELVFWGEQLAGVTGPAITLTDLIAGVIDEPVFQEYLGRVQELM